MRKLLIAISVCALIGWLVAIAWAQQPTRQGWEYKFEYSISEKRANALGSEGWELVAVGSAGSGPASNVETFVFKRLK